MDSIKEGSVLLVGEGDFSFSVAFSKHVRRSVAITTSSLLTEAELSNLHKNGSSNLQHLRDQGIKVLFSVDATKLNEQSLGEFSRIIFNFPHVGGKSNIKKNRELLQNFFASAVKVLAEDGDICISFCRGQGGTPADRPIRAWHDSWQAAGAAAYHNLVLWEIWPFTEEAYPEYSSTGFRSMDRNFFTGDATTYVFLRCVPLHVTPEALDLKPGHLQISGKTYTIQSSYLAEKFDRNLLNIQDHPVHLTATHVLDQVRNHSRLPVVEHCTCSPIIGGISSAYIVTPDISDAVAAEVREKSAECSLHLRRSMLDHFCDESSTGDLTPGSLHVFQGNVCRMCPRICSMDLPVQHELFFVSPGDNALEDLDKFKALFSSVISEVISAESKVLIAYGLDDHIDPVNDHPGISNLYSLEIAYKSQCAPQTEACNQVTDLGPPSIPNPSPKLVKLSKHVGIVCTKMYNKKQYIIATLTMDSLAMVKYDIPDARLLWSKDPAFLQQFSGRELSDSTSFKPLSLYPPLWRHDLSFWEPSDEQFSEQTMLDIIRDVAGDALKKVILRNTWQEPGTGRKSRCYRLVYQSYEHAISHSMAHDYQTCVRDTLTEVMNIELR